MFHDIDADYSPQYVKLARIIRGKIESGEYKRMDALPAAGLADAYGVSMQVAYAALTIRYDRTSSASRGGSRLVSVGWPPSM